MTVGAATREAPPRPPAWGRGAPPGRICLRGNTLTLPPTCAGTTADPGTPCGSGDEGAGPFATAPGWELAAREIEAFLQGGLPDLVFFFGHGDGRHAAALRRRTSAPIIAYEPEKASAASPALPGVTVVRTRAALMDAAASVVDLASRRVMAGAIPALRTAMPDVFARFVEAVEQALVDAQIRRATHQRSAETWLKDLAANLPEVAAMPPLDLLGGRFSGCPGIFIGAGPSLDCNLEQLRRAQGHAVLCAASTALPALARAGIVPELVVTIEGNDQSCHFAGVPHLDRMTLLPGPLSHPAHFALPVGSRLALAPQGSVAGDWLHRAWGRHQLDVGGSVACTGFAVLHLLGCDPLALVGMDLALTGGRTHAAGTEQATRRVRFEPEAGRVFHWFEDKAFSGYWQVVSATGWGGGTVLTRPVFNSFRLWFEGAAETWAGDRRLFNATEGGARIHGFAETTLRDWLAAHAAVPLDARGVIDGVLAAAPPVSADPLWREVAAELSVVREAAASAAEAERLALRALRSLEARRFGGLDAQLATLAAAESRLSGCTRRTRLLNALVGERTQALAHGEAPPPETRPVDRTAWSLRRSLDISRLVGEGARELEGWFGPLAARAAADAAAPLR